MNVLIVDRDEASAHLLSARLAQPNVAISVVPSRADALEYITKNPNVDAVLMDPSPAVDPRAGIKDIRAAIPTRAYITVTSADIDEKSAKMAGANDLLHKPFSPADMAAWIENARTMLDLEKRLNDPSQDFPSGGGIIAKSAFCQLFLSAVDRSERYGEEAHILFISLQNFNQIKVNDSDYAAGIVAATLAQQIVKIRRGSDILGQTGPHEYALLLQRPTYETEALDATLRFADTLNHNKALRDATRAEIDLSVRLVDVPSGRTSAAHDIRVV